MKSCLAAVGLIAGLACFAADELVIVRTTVSGVTNQISRRDCHSISIVLSNTTGQSLTGLTARLSTPTLGAEVTQPASPYPVIPPGGIATNTIPFKLGTAIYFACGTPLELGLSVADTNGFSTTFSIQQPSLTNCLVGNSSCGMTNLLFGGLASGDQLQNSRLNPNGIIPQCATPKPCPGLYPPEIGSPVPRFYDAYRFVNNSGTNACIIVEVITGCRNAATIFSASYLGGFVPTNLCENYLADCGSSPPPNTSPFSRIYSFMVANAAFFDVVVHQAPTDVACTNYTLRVSAVAGFDVYLPRFEIARSGSDVWVAWPTNAFFYRLEATPVLPGPFLPETNIPIRVGEQFRITNSGTDPARFFRLRKQ